MSNKSKSIGLVLLLVSAVGLLWWFAGGGSSLIGPASGTEQTATADRTANARDAAAADQAQNEKTGASATNSQAQDRQDKEARPPRKAPAGYHDGEKQASSQSHAAQNGEDEDALPKRLISGVVVDADGQTVSRATVFLARLNAGGEQTTESDDRGTFSFEVLETEQYRLWAESFDQLDRSRTATILLSHDDPRYHGPFTLQLQAAARIHLSVVNFLTKEPVADAEYEIWESDSRFSGTTDEQGKARILLPPGQVSLMVKKTFFSTENKWFQADPGDFQLEIVLEPAGEIHGRVTDTEGNPIQDARLYASFHGSSFSYRLTDEFGDYRLTNLPFGKTLDISIDHHLYRDATAKVTINEENPRQEKHFVLERAEDNTYRVEGKVSDEDGEPIAGVSIRCFGPSFQGMVVSDQDGLFLMEDIPKDLRYFSAAHPDYAGHSFFAEPVDGISRHEFVLKRKFLVTGYLLKPDQSVYKGLVMYQIIEPAENNSLSGSRMQQQTNEKGLLTFVVLPGSSLRIKADGYTAVETEAFSTGQEDLTWLLEEESLFEAFVFDRESRDPVREFTVMFRQPPSSHFLGDRNVLNENGFFSLTNYEIDKELHLRIQAPGYKTVDLDYPAYPEQPVPIELEAAPKRTIVGRVTDGQGNPVAGVTVRAVGSNHQGYRANLGLLYGRDLQRVYEENTQSDGQGRFTFPNLDESVYGIHIWTAKPGHADAVQLFVNQSQGPVELVLQPEGRIHGRVNQEKFGDRTMVFLLEYGNGSINTSMGNIQDGTYSFEGLRPGHYRVALQQVMRETTPPPGENLYLEPGAVKQVDLGFDDQYFLSAKTAMEGNGPGYPAAVEIQVVDGPNIESFVVPTAPGGIITFSYHRAAQLVIWPLAEAVPPNRAAGYRFGNAHHLRLEKPTTHVELYFSEGNEPKH